MRVEVYDYFSYSNDKGVNSERYGDRLTAFKAGRKLVAH